MSENRERSTGSQERKGRRLEELKEFITNNRKTVLPIVLVAALLITLGIGLLANRKKEEPEEVEANAIGELAGTEVASEGIPVPDVPLELNAYPEVNELIMSYYKAMESGEIDNLAEIVSPLTESYEIRFREVAKHVEACPAVNIYTKPGPVEDSFVAYVYTEIQLVGYSEKTVPGMKSFYICKNDEGKYYINIEEEVDQEIADYIAAMSLQADVKDLNNKVTASFNELVAEDEAMGDNYDKVTQSITKGVQEAMQAKNEAENEEQPTEDTQELQPAVVTPTGKTVKATDVVNMRSSDSEIADKLGKAQIGDTFTVLEERANGWTKLTDGTQEFFIKSEYLETVSEGGAAEETGEAPAENTPQETPAEVNLSLGSSGYVTAKTTVNIRKSASETADKLGVVYQGEKLELVMNQADGWCKVKYKGQTAYVKSEFME